MNLTVKGSTILRAGTHPLNGFGVVVFNDADESGGRARLVVRNSTFDGGSPPTMAGSVFAVTDVDALIDGNTVRRTTFSCIQPQGDANVDVIGNDVDECGPFGGIRAPMSPGTVVNIIGNTVRNTTATDSRLGIRLLSASGRIERNTVVDYVQPSAGDESAIHVGQEATPVVRFNDISGNAFAGLSVTQLTTIDATCNWWGSADGPSGDGPGSGDAVFGPATFVPFATQPVAASGDGECGDDDDDDDEG